MPWGAWRHFWRQFIKIWGLNYIFWRKMNVLEILSSGPVTLIKSEIFPNVPEPQAELWILHARLHYIQLHLLSAIFIVTQTAYEYVWMIKLLCVTLLLFKALREIIFLRLVSCRICCTTLKVHSVIVNYLCWRCFFVTEISPGDKSSII